jgi:predicted ArsR family transcriptional regulator
VELSRRDVDVLCCLRERGPMTRAQIADALRLRGTARRLYNRRGRPILAKLRRAGLVEVTGWRGDRPAYGLCDSHRGSPQPRGAANERL